MKKLFFMLMLALSIASISFMGVGCNKDEKESCDCGTVTDYGYDGYDYWVAVRNECSGNIGYFSMSYYDWLDTWPGDYVCASDGDSWKKKSTPADPSSSCLDQGKPDKPF